MFVDVLDAHHPRADDPVADAMRTLSPMVHPTAADGRLRYPDVVAKVIGLTDGLHTGRRWTRRRLAAPVPRRRRARQRVQGGRAPRPRPAVGDGEAAEAGAPARCAAARSRPVGLGRRRRPACGWRRRAPTSSPPPSRSSTAAEMRARRAAPADVAADPPRRRPLPARLDRGRRAAGRARRPRRGRHPDRRPARARRRGRVGFTEGPAAPLGLRSERRRPGGDRPGRRARHPWYGRRRASRAGTSSAPTLVLARRVGHADVVEAALAALRVGRRPGSGSRSTSSAAARLPPSTATASPSCRAAGSSSDLRTGDARGGPGPRRAHRAARAGLWRGARPRIPLPGASSSTFAGCAWPRLCGGHS